MGWWQGKDGGRAAERLGRRCMMMECDPVYATVIIDRWERMTARSANPVVERAMVAANTMGGALFRCPRCMATGNPYDGFCRKCGFLLPKDRMLWRANELLERELRRTTPRGIRGLAYVRGVGRIDLEVGKRGSGPGMDFGSGLAKLLQKHPEGVKKLGVTLVLGKSCRHEDENKIVRVGGSYYAVLGKRPKGASVITHYKDAKKAVSYESRLIGRR